MDMSSLFAALFPLATPDPWSPTVLAGLLAVFLLHATVLLGLAWLLERVGALRHPGWAEFVWRLALFGAFASVALRGMSLMPVTVPAPSAAAPPIVSASAAGPATAAHVVPAPSAVTATAVVPATPAAPTVAPLPRLHPASPIALPVTEDAIVLGLALWLLGMLWAGFRLLRQARALLRLRRRALRDGATAPPALGAMLQALAAELRLPVPAMRLMPRLESPMVVPGAILLPAWAEALPPSQQRAMLAHELAHVQRRDPRWRFLQRLALVPLFFHPLAWHALRRLEALAETQCDRVAADRDGARALAECLAECLARVAPAGVRPVGLALAMAERDGGIVERVRALLERTPDATRPPSRRRRWIIAGGVLLALVALPGVIVVARPGWLPDLMGPSPLSIVFRKGNETYRIQTGMPVAGDTLHARIDGDVVFSPDERTVLRVGPGARFEIEQRHAGILRVLHMTNDAGGVKRTYSVDGQPHPFDAGAQAWLAEAIPAIYRLSGFDAEARAGRILAAHGVPGLLDEIARLDAGGARADYLVQLFAQAAPDAAQTDRALALLRDIDGDYDKRRALDAPLARPDLSAAQQASLLAIAAGLGSDFDRAEWLVSAAPKLPFEGVTTAGWSQALAGIGGDYDRQRTLQAVIEHGQPRPQAVSLALRAMHGMGGDFERRTVLQAVVQAGVPLVDEDVLAAIDAIGGDYDRSEALLAFIAGARPDTARSRAILAHVRGIGSDFDRGRVLAGLAAAMPADAQLIADYRDVARTLPDFDRGQAEKALDRFAPM